MKQNVILALVAVSSVAAVFATGNAEKKAPLTAAAQVAALPEKEQAARRAAIQKRVMEQHGGIIEREGVGALAIVNCQERADISSITPKLNDFRKASRMVIKEMPGTFRLDAVKIPDGISAAVFIVDNPSFPMSLVAIEGKWGMMNVAPLLADSPDKAKADKRIAKDFVKIAALTFGGGCSQYSGSPLQPAFDSAGLDSVSGEHLTIDIVKAMSRNLTALGMKPSVRSTYRKACEEGWAPAPTNEFQKAVWDKVHSAPKTPMKIKFDPKKGR